MRIRPLPVALAGVATLVAVGYLLLRSEPRPVSRALRMDELEARVRRRRSALALRTLQARAEPLLKETRRPISDLAVRLQSAPMLRSGDNEWRRLPRTSFDLAERLANSPGSLRIEDLLRHRDLNPDDVHVARSLRYSLAARFTYGVRLAREALELARERARLELRELVRAGRARRLRLPAELAAALRRARRPVEDLDRETLEALFGARPVPFARLPDEGVLYWAPLEELPETREAGELYARILRGVLDGLTSTFEAIGALRRGAGAELQAQLDRALARVLI